MSSGFPGDTSENPVVLPFEPFPVFVLIGMVLATLKKEKAVTLYAEPI
ncbi:hypothetical protein REC12_23200 [Desulfosporosinus sp. PR]|nr:hypothetical protein [Desulfosporosinus sp. PR]MDQ7096507.1 hypothetical protein [Desulfosporosinus sp. PR]